MSNSSCNFIPWDINSYDGKLMFAAIISLLLVISFVLLLHAYARWVFVLGQSADRQRLAALSLSTTTTITTTTTTTRLHHHLHTDDNHQISSFDDDDIDGLDVSVITSIPIFVHKSDDNHICNKLECAICLSVFEENDKGRHLPSCNHAFHVQCIDKWLRSHSTCPICRAVVGSKKTVESKSIMAIDDVLIQERTERSHVHSDSPENEDPVLEVVIEMPPLESNSECNVHDSSLSSPPPAAPPLESNSECNVHNSSLSSPPPAAPPLPQLCTGYYLKRILSMNRAENKVFPSSSNVNV